jgi:hypothetical protein
MHNLRFKRAKIVPISTPSMISHQVLRLVLSRVWQAQFVPVQVGQSLTVLHALDASRKTL